MTKTKDQLFNIWLEIWDIPEWLRILKIGGAYDKEDLIFLEQIDQRAIERAKNHQEYYKKSILPKVQDQIKEFEKEFDPAFIKKKKLEYLDSSIEALEKIINQIWKDFKEDTERDIPYFLRRATRDLRQVDSLEKQLASLKMRKYLMKMPKKAKSKGVSPEEIKRALEVPFDRLIQFNKAGFALCPFHEETTPSLHWIKDSNRVYCFGCSYSANTIKYIEDSQHLNFIKAVKFLNQL